MRDRGLPQRDGVVGVGHIATDRAVHLLVLEEQDGVVVADRGAQQSASVVRGRRHDHLQPRDVREEGLDALRVVQRAVDAAAVRSAHDHRHAVAVVRAVAHPRRLGDQLVERGEDEVRELDLGDRPKPIDGSADRRTDDHRLGQRRIDHPVVAELRPQPVRREEDAALLADVLAEHDHRLVPPHLVCERLADRLDERPRRHQSTSSTYT